MSLPTDPPTQPMQLRVRHTAGVVFESGASASIYETRMIPLNTSRQHVMRSRLEIRPAPWSYEYTDYWGTSVTSFEVYEPHDEITVVASSTVQTREPERPVGSLDWQQLAEVEDQYCEFLALGELTEPAPELAVAVRDLRTTSASPAALVRAVTELVADHVTVTSDAESTLASQVWTNGEGTLEGLVHVAIGALRHGRVPARYVSGYLHPDPAPVIGEPAQVRPGAWLEYFDADWIGFDPGHGIGQSPGHVAVARGRDYADNAPLRGIHSTDGLAQSFAEVEIVRVQ